MDEQIDVYSMGNNVYTLLTGLWPFYEYKKSSVVKPKIKNGERPFVDERYRTRSFIESRLVTIMERMWEYRPEDRPTIFEVVQYLYETKEIHLMRGNATRGSSEESFSKLSVKAPAGTSG